LPFSLAPCHSLSHLASLSPSHLASYLFILHAYPLAHLASLSCLATLAPCLSLWEPLLTTPNACPVGLVLSTTFCHQATRGF
jgi:hypothetical protein